MIPYLDNLPAAHDTTFTTTDGVVIVTIQMVLIGPEEKFWVCEFIYTYIHLFFQEQDPIRHEES